MENAPIHLWAGYVFVGVYALTLIIRWVRARNPLSYHIGPAFIGASGTLAIVESLYLLYYFFHHGSLEGLQGLQIYALAGALALVVVGFTAVIQGLKE